MYFHQVVNISQLGCEHILFVKRLKRRSNQKLETIQFPQFSHFLLQGFPFHEPNMVFPHAIFNPSYHSTILNQLSTYKWNTNVQQRNIQDISTHCKLSFSIFTYKLTTPFEHFPQMGSRAQTITTKIIRITLILEKNV